MQGPLPAFHSKASGPWRHLVWYHRSPAGGRPRFSDDQSQLGVSGLRRRKNFSHELWLPPCMPTRMYTIHSDSHKHHLPSQSFTVTCLLMEHTERGRNVCWEMVADRVFAYTLRCKTLPSSIDGMVIFSMPVGWTRTTTGMPYFTLSVNRSCIHRKHKCFSKERYCNIQYAMTKKAPDMKVKTPQNVHTLFLGSYYYLAR